MSELRGLHLHFDGTAGAAGDMTLGALFDLGVPLEVVTDVVAKLGLGADRVTATRVVKGGIAAMDVKVRADDADGGHGHGHGHDHDHHHHHYRDIRAQIAGAALAPEVERLALDIFDRVARAEAKLHGTTVEAVAFHEVGAIDSIVDIVGAAAALAWLAPASVSASAVAVGHGAAYCAHGKLPVPTPATAEIFREAGGLTIDGGVDKELCTPTGAAILSAVVTQWGSMPALTPVAIGYGAGDRELTDRPNVLRAIAGKPQAGAGAEELYRLEANVDDMSPEMCEHAAEAMFAAGAVDVWWTPIQMKKSRPALQVSALAPEPALEPVLRAALRETTSIGVRFDRVSRRALARDTVTVSTRYGELPIKVARLDGVEVNAAPEYEACRAAARHFGAPLKAVFAAAIAAYEAVKAD